jgi:Iodothyronine deiodinase
LYATYRGDVDFYVVYIREAHPTDGWQVGQNQRDKILFEQPTSLDQRQQIAHQMCTALKLSMPTLIDGLDDKVNQAYAGWPDRLYLVGRDGKVAFKGAPGPAGFRPHELEVALKEIVPKPSRPPAAKGDPAKDAAQKPSTTPDNVAKPGAIHGGATKP